MIPAEAVRAAFIAIYERDHIGGVGSADIRRALEAAAPYMHRGDGDYRPGWDDRKKLSGVWQEHAPLPAEGLSERVYEALIEVAAWGYQQRMDEEV